MINAVTRSGTNEFEFGTEVVWEPSSLQSAQGPIASTATAIRYIIGSYDEYDRTNATVYASGPIVKDKLFFFALYEARDYEPRQHRRRRQQLLRRRRRTTASGARRSTGRSTTGTCSSCSRSPTRTRTVTRQLRLRRSPTGERGALPEHALHRQRRPELGGDLHRLPHRHACPMKVLYGENEREFSRVSHNDIECNRVRDLRAAAAATSAARPPPASPSAPTRAKRRAWTSNGSSAITSCASAWTTRPTRRSTASSIPGPDRLLYEMLRARTPGATRERRTGPAGGTEYVRTRRTRSTASSRRSTRPTTSRTTGRSPTAWC